MTRGLAGGRRSLMALSRLSALILLAALAGLAACLPKTPVTKPPLSAWKVKVTIQEGISRYLDSIGFCDKEEVFTVSCQVDGEKVILSGEASEPAHKTAMLEIVSSLLPEIKIIDNITVLPGPSLGDDCWGVLRVPVADLGDGPNSSGGDHTVTQARMGDRLRLLKENLGWYLCQMDDNYLGWIAPSDVWVTDKDPAEAFFLGHVALVTAQMTAAYRSPNGDLALEENLVQGTVLPIVAVEGQWANLSLPGGLKVWVKAGDVFGFDSYNKVFSEAKGAEGILETAKQYVGLPYLWGGCTSQGFDCSGFTQFCMKMNGYFIRRDAHMQHEQGEEVAKDDLSPGDLVFFSDNGRTASHVGIYMGDSLYIHSAGTGLAINSFDSSHPDYIKSRNDTYLGARRIIK